MNDKRKNDELTLEEMAQVIGGSDWEADRPRVKPVQPLPKDEGKPRNDDFGSNK